MKRNVLVLTTEWPSEGDAVNGIFVREFALAASEVADVSVVAVKRERSRGFYDVDEPDDDLPVKLVRYRRFGKPLSLLTFFLGARAAIHSAGRKFDVVHTHSFLSTVLAWVLLRKVPVVFTEHWSIFLPDDPGELSPAMRVLARIALRHAAIVLPPSRAQERALAAVAPNAHFRIVHNAVDTSLFKPGPSRHAAGGSPRLVCVGMMTEDRSKGIDVLLQASRELADAGREFTIDLAGDGPRREEYEQLARDLGTDGRVTFHGLLAKPDVAALLRECDLFVLASRFENNPCALIEAMASGLPTVATNVGGLPEMVEAETGVLVEPGDPPALARGIEQALGRLQTFDPTAIARLAHERYGRDAIAAQLDAVYDEAVARR